MAIRIQEYVPLRDLTTLKIGGTARYFVSVGTVFELSEAVAFAKEKQLPFLILGGGSNVLISDKELNAVVLQIAIRGIDWSYNSLTNPGVSQTVVTVGAGENWDGLVAEAVRRGLWGIENLSGIPGTVGAAPIQNIGAYGAEIGDVLEWVEVFTKKGEAVPLARLRLSAEECRLGYRDSIFKKPKGKHFIVTRVALRLSKEGTPNLEYKDLKSRISNSQFLISNETGEKKNEKEITPRDIRIAVLEIRSKKFPDLKQFGTAGSFFKNPIIPKAQFDELKKKYPALPGFELRIKDEGLRMKVPLAWILDNLCGLKGYQKGTLALFERQPIVLVNRGGASAQEIEAFAENIAFRVREKTGIEIEWEVRHLK